MHCNLRPVAVLAVLLAMSAGAAAQSEAGKSPTEARAVGYIHTLVTAQREYKKKHNQYARSMAALVGNGSFTRRMATSDRGDYMVGFGSSGAGFWVSLTPRTFDAEHRAFYANENGTIHVEPDKPANSQSPVLKE